MKIKTILLTVTLLGAALNGAAETTETLASACDRAWAKAMTTRNPETGVITGVKDFSKSVPPADAKDNLYPMYEKRPGGWGPPGVGDQPLILGTALSGLVDKWELTRDPQVKADADQVAEGLINLAVLHGYRGFVCRGLCADGKTTCSLSSRDQYTHWIQGLWRYSTSALADPKIVAAYRRTVAEVADFMARRVTPESGWNFGLANSPEKDYRGICTMWGPDVWPHEAARLPMIYLAAFLATDDARWKSLYEKYIDEALDRTLEVLKVDPKKPNGRMPCYSLYQANVSLEPIADYERATPRGEKAKRALAAFANLARVRMEKALAEPAAKPPYGMCWDGELLFTQALDPAFAADAAFDRFLDAAISRQRPETWSLCRTAHLMAAYWRVRRLAARPAPRAIEPSCAFARGWKLVPELSDEFDGPTLDSAKWADWCRSFQGRSADGAFGTPCENGFLFSPENVSVENGELVLTTRLLAEHEKTRQNEYLRYAPWSTAIVKSRTRQRYGCFEIRAKVMKACVSNAFWLYDPHSDDPAAKFSAGDVSEEIDIFESKGAPDFRGLKTAGSNMLLGTMHFYCTPYLEGLVNRRKVYDNDMQVRHPLDFNLADDYHTYGLVWTPEKLVWTLDGEIIATRKNNGRYHRPLHVTLDAEVFADWFGVPDPASLPAKFRIDYVRVWACPEKGPDGPAPHRGLVNYTPPRDRTLRLPRHFGSDMVLQQGQPLNVRGWGAPGDLVDVAFAGTRASGEVAADGSWRVTLPAPEISKTPRSLVVKAWRRGECAAELVCTNVLVGEVWVLSGQSNMQRLLPSSDGWPRVAEQGDQPLLRYMLTDCEAVASEPCLDSPLEARWTVCTRDVLERLSAVGFYFGERLMKDRDVPVGLVMTACGGTAMGCWTPPDFLDRSPTLARIVESRRGDSARWKIRAPSIHWNSKIAPLAGLSIAGVLWYQGETEAWAVRKGDPAWTFGEHLENLIVGWRAHWGREIPFVVSELASMGAANPKDFGRSMIRLRQHEVAAKLPRVAVACIADTGDEKDVHPSEKERVGTRLAQQARRMVYNEASIARSPVAQSATFSPEGALVTIRTDSGLVAKGELRGFEVRVGGVWQSAAGVEIRGESVFVKSPSGKPDGVRYLWANWAKPLCSLYDGQDNPVTTFLFPVE